MQDPFAPLALTAPRSFAIISEHYDAQGNLTDTDWLIEGSDRGFVLEYACAVVERLEEIGVYSVRWCKHYALLYDRDGTAIKMRCVPVTYASDAEAN